MSAEKVSIKQRWLRFRYQTLGIGYIWAYTYFYIAVSWLPVIKNRIRHAYDWLYFRAIMFIVAPITFRYYRVKGWLNGE